MSVTAQQVINRLDAVFNDSGNGKFTPAQKLEFTNAAVDAAWGYGIKTKSLDTSITLASGTFEYTPTSTPELEDGYAAVYVTPLASTAEPKVRLKRVWQKLNGTTWTIVFPNDTVVRYTGKAIQLYYNSRVARAAAATDSIELPLDFLWQYAAWVACTSGVMAGANFNSKPFEQMFPVWYQNATRLGAGLQRGFITKLPVTYESGRTAAINPNAGVYHV